MSYHRKKRESVILEREEARVASLYTDELREHARRTKSCTCTGCMRVTVVVGTALFYCGAILFFIFILIARE